MGLFNRSKKKDAFADINPLDINSIVRAYKSQNPAASEEDVIDFVKKLSEPDKNQEHLTAEGELPWGWYSVHEQEISMYTAEYKKLWAAWYDSRSKTPSEHLTALEAFVNYMNRAKITLLEKGECFNYWRGALFTDEYLERLTKELCELKVNTDNAEQEYNAKKKFEINVLPTLEHGLLSIIKETPGILQKDIYKMFAPEGKNYIQEKLYFAEKAGKISREKCGSSYRLFSKQA